MKSDYGTSKILGFVAACLLFLPILFIVTLVYRDSLSYIIHAAGGSFDLQVRFERGRRQNAPSETNAAAIDKLLGGLLASGFNESSCLSRYQSSSYRIPSPHKPSPYLVQKLRRYEALHSKCGPNTNLYNKTLEKLKSGHTDGTEGCNYLIWVPVSGLGNRILTLTSAFLYTLLTDRVLLIDSGMEMSNLFCEPFPLSSWLLPLDFPSIPNKRSENSFGYLLRNNSLNELARRPLFAYLHLAHDYDYFDKQFFCEEGQLLLKGIPWLTLRSDVYFAPSLFLIPSLEEELTQLFPKKDTVFHHLGRYLFHPSNSVWKLVLRYYQAYLADADERLGIQVRVFDNGPGPFQHVLNQILSCSLNQTLLPQVGGQEERTSTVSTTPKRKAVLMTSLSSWYHEEMRSMYWEQPTVTGEIVSVFQPSHEGRQQTGRQMHDMKAWAEVYLLSLSDELITSSRSTFGYVAQGLRGLRPWILFRPENQTVPQPPCGRAISMEPCFHSPPSYDCKAKRNVDMGAFVPYLRHCEDVPSGIKLVDVTSL